MTGRNKGLFAVLLAAAMLFSVAGCTPNNQVAATPNALPSGAPDARASTTPAASPDNAQSTPSAAPDTTPSATPTASADVSPSAEAAAYKPDRTKIYTYKRVVAPGVDAQLAELAWKSVDQTASFVFGAGSLVAEARITKIERMQTVYGLLRNPIELWKLEYRLKPENLEVLKADTNSRLNFEDGYVTEYDRSEWQPVMVVQRTDSGPHLIFTLSTHFFEASGGVDATLKSMLRDKIADYKRVYTLEGDVDHDLAVLAWPRVMDGVYYLESISNPNELSILEAKITKLTKIATFNNALSNPVEAWRLEYRLKPDEFSHVILADGMTSEDGWVTQKSIVGDPIILIERTKYGANYLGSTSPSSFGDGLTGEGFKALLEKVQTGKDYLRVATAATDEKVMQYIWDYIDTQVALYFKGGSDYPNNKSIKTMAAGFDTTKLTKTFDGVLDAPVELWRFSYRFLPENKNPIMFAVGGQNAKNGWFIDAPLYLIVKRTSSGPEYLGVARTMAFEGGLTEENLKRVLSDLKTAK